jgi:hypothetical protein
MGTKLHVHVTFQAERDALVTIAYNYFELWDNLDKSRPPRLLSMTI